MKMSIREDQIAFQCFIISPQAHGAHQILGAHQTRLSENITMEILREDFGGNCHILDKKELELYPCLINFFKSNIYIKGRSKLSENVLVDTQSAFRHQDVIY